MAAPAIFSRPDHAGYLTRIISAALFVVATGWNPCALAGAGDNALRSEADQALGRDDYDNAAKRLSSYLAAHPSDADARVEYAFALSMSGRTEAAASEYEKARASGFKDVEQLLDYGFEADGHEVAGPAVLAYAEAAELAPNDPRPPFYLGELHSRLGMTEQAETELRRAVQLDGRNLSARNLLAVTLAQQSKDSEARTLWEQVLAADPANESARLNLAKMRQEGQSLPVKESQ